MLSPIYSVIYEIYIIITPEIYGCRYSVRYGEWEAEERYSARSMLEFVDKKIRAGYKLKSSKEYEMLVKAAQKPYT